ncbi:oxidoreductase, short chain dehydrogenase/reductase family [Aspergillus lucknowensis]|uniref:Oxidoreductase n=1 Tax=Aspergillus lucknowensis TaxID=176173 RepID=A0ABR4LCD0_9EURO
MATKPVAIIVGVGAGTGASVARRFAKEYSVAVIARNPENYDPLVAEINSSGGQAFGVSADVTDSNAWQSAFNQIFKHFKDAPLAAAVFNPGGGVTWKPFLEITEDEFAVGLNSQATGAFNFAKSTLPLLLKSTNLQHPPTLIFTGATASVRGSANFAAFAAGKFALRALAQSLAREFGPQGVHVAHIVVDGVIDIPRTKEWKNEHPDAKLDPAAIADTYWHLHTQPRTTFGFELDLRPYIEKW